MSVPGTYLTGWRWLRGRARRREYVLWLAVIAPWSYVAAWAQNPWVQSVLAYALVFQTIRRLHDLGRSGWWVAAIYVTALVLAFLPSTYPDAAAAYWLPVLFPLAALLTIALVPGERVGNRFGPPPASRAAVAPAA